MRKIQKSEDLIYITAKLEIMQWQIQYITSRDNDMNL